MDRPARQLGGVVVVVLETWGLIAGGLHIGPAKILDDLFGPDVFFVPGVGQGPHAKRLERQGIRVDPDIRPLRVRPSSAVAAEPASSNKGN